MNRSFFSEDMKIADLILANGRLLCILPYFGIQLGFGEKTIKQMCDSTNLSAPLLLLVCNLYTFNDYKPENAELKQIPVEGIVKYLQHSHKDYLEVRMPRIINAILDLAKRFHFEGGNMLTSFCERYKQEVMAHFKYEEEVVFPYISQLLNGGKPDYKISEYESNHSDIEAALEDLKNIIIKYLPPACPIEECRPALLDLFAFEHDLRKHTLLEDSILIPLVERLDYGGQGGFDGVELTEREKEILTALARGLSNKEIADKLYLSTHTVISHRKNIVRKTGIKTPQGLTLYAFLNGFVTHDNLR